MKIRFQIVLKKVVQPEYYLLGKLFPLVQAEASSLGDYDLETVKSWISIDYFTAYHAVPNRKLLGFTINLPDSFGDRGRLLLDKYHDSNTTCFAQELQNDGEIVETILRYEDDYILENLRNYQPEIFEIEMKLREVLTYLLAYNLPNNTMDDFLGKFEGAEFANKEMTDKGKRIKRYNDYFENGLFHLAFTKYSVVHKDNQKKPKAEYVLQKIQEVNTFEELKQSFYQITFSDVNPKHLSFLDNIKAHLSPIEAMRNEVMHNRKPNMDSIQNYERAKEGLLRLINEFWQDEKIYQPDIEAIKSYLLDMVLHSLTFDSDTGDNVKFIDLNFEEKEMWIEEFKIYVYEQIDEILSTAYNYRFDDAMERLFYEALNSRLDSLLGEK